MYEIVDKFDFEITATDVLKGQGIDPERASERLLNTAESILAEAMALVKPAAMYTLLEVKNFEHRKIDFEGGSFEGSLVGKAFAGAEHLYLAVCTIGEILEKKVEEMMSENPVAGIALDGAGIAAVGYVSRKVEDIISKEVCELNLSLGMRAQPGQEGWPIEQQRQVFSILPAEKIGMKLTESCLMLPRKSVSFVIPRGKELNNSVVPCDFCSKRNRCDWKKEKQAG